MKNITYDNEKLCISNILEQYYIITQNIPHHNKILKCENIKYINFLFNDFHVLKLTEHHTNSFSHLRFRADYYNHIDIYYSSFDIYGYVYSYKFNEKVLKL